MKLSLELVGCCHPAWQSSLCPATSPLCLLHRHSFHFMSMFRRDVYRETLGMVVQSEQCSTLGLLVQVPKRSIDS